MAENVPEGPYTLWIDYGYEGWRPTDFQTLVEALQAERFCSRWVITKTVRYEVIDNSPQSEGIPNG